MLKTAVLGYPRIGEGRELKKATEAYWKGEISREALEETGREIRRKNWLAQKEAGIDFIPSNDFSFYDQVLDMTALLGAVPPRYGWKGKKVDVDTTFSMARGIQEKQGVQSASVPAMEMTKWFDTNYHYIVPEFYKATRFQVSSDKPFAEFKEALALGVKTRPVLIGPVTYLLLGKAKDEGLSVFDLLNPLVDVYVSLLKEFQRLGALSIQMDEPALVLDLDKRAKEAFKKAYRRFAEEAPQVSLMLTPYFGSLKNNLEFAASLPVAGLHLDWVRAPKDLGNALRLLPKEKTLSLGVVDGRNVWKSDLQKIIDSLGTLVKRRDPDRLLIASSCSLLHSPLDLDLEMGLDEELKGWLSFSRQKLREIKVIQLALSGREKEAAPELKQNRKDVQSRQKSRRIHKKEVEKKLKALKRKDAFRKSPFKVRRLLQKKRLGLPLFPTTTIGSFPQTADVRQARARFKKGFLTIQEYQDFLKDRTRDAVGRQRQIGLDVFVHGEFERNDMVEYFGEQLEGFAFTEHGWVQSYGSRYVKPPIIYGDVLRTRPMTVEWFEYAQSLTDKPVKGMLTGPITILQWSFVRDDQPRSETAKQIALAVREETLDLEKAGARIVQIDEPAIREGLPLRKSDWTEYLRWAVDAFKLASAGVRDETQVHTHMCYSEFNDIIDAVAAMDADVISIETSRSQMELLKAFVRFRYPNEIGPGVYDIHSPRVPAPGDIRELLEKASRVIPAENLWVNPDCGLKTRAWEETTPALKAMVQAAKAMREAFSHGNPRPKSHPRSLQRCC
ncbi:MAG: 5-methyltetrahydropteroyltriglutamate--homocysteine S-methyltransferase [Candidatus Omnitrophica bacterium]|nr:5-methyltetrahydropteroyltriglutamate--homocysteine S-methyltransferase [Candidatus Omnitrophota bacterium]